MAILDVFRKGKEDARFAKKNLAKKQEKEEKNEKVEKPVVDKKKDGEIKAQTKKPVKKEEKAKTPTSPAKAKEPKKVLGSSVSLPKGGNSSSIIVGQHITEKASDSRAKGVYVFKVNAKANKVMISQAIKETYKVSPVKVNIICTPGKRRVSRRKVGFRPGIKKAMVYLRKGDVITA
jgi:large subunit ribosomal protein L23